MGVDPVRSTDSVVEAISFSGNGVEYSECIYRPAVFTGVNVSIDPWYTQLSSIRATKLKVLASVFARNQVRILTGVERAIG